MTRMYSQTRVRSVTRSISPIQGTIIIDDIESPPPKLDHATLFKTLKNLLGDGINLAMGVQYAALQKMFTWKMQSIIDRRMQVLSKIQPETMQRVIDQMKQDNARL